MKYCTLLTAFALPALLVSMQSCSDSRAGNAAPPSDAPSTVAATPVDREFAAYWYQGAAELDRYALTQARYGELRHGTAVMIFVTEDFMTNELVKDDGVKGGPKTSVLKTNLLERYNTGIYDYSHMSSVFSPVDGSPALKANTTIQDWCGHIFCQVRRKGEGYVGELFSYFQREGDKQFTTGDVWLEDALWNQVRIDPARLPTGPFKMLPSLRYLRLMHKPTEAVDATAQLVAKDTLSTYRVEMPALHRVLEIHFDPRFPHAISGWDETRPDGFGERTEILTTTARLTHTLRAPYWQLNSNANDSLRSQLGLERKP